MKKMKKVFLKTLFFALCGGMILLSCRKDDDENKIVFENKLVKSAAIRPQGEAIYRPYFYYNYDDQRRLTNVNFGLENAQKPWFTFTYDAQNRIKTIVAVNYTGTYKYVLNYNGNGTQIVKFTKEILNSNMGIEEIIPQYNTENQTITYTDKDGAVYTIRTDVQDRVITFFEKKDTETLSFSYEYDMTTVLGLHNVKTPVVIPLYIVAGEHTSSVSENQPLNVMTNYAVTKYSVVEGSYNQQGTMENTKTPGNLLEKSRINYGEEKYRDMMFIYE